MMYIFNRLDTDGNGVIEYTEFLAALLETDFYTKEINLRKTFNILDVDGNGVLTLDEIKQLFGGNKCI